MAGEPIPMDLNSFLRPLRISVSFGHCFSIARLFIVCLRVKKNYKELKLSLLQIMRARNSGASPPSFVYQPIWFAMALITAAMEQTKHHTHHVRVSLSIEIFEKKEKKHWNICVSDVETKTILGLEMTWLVLIAVSAFLVLSACFVGCTIWICRSRTSSSLDNNNLQC